MQFIKRFLLGIILVAISLGVIWGTAGLTYDFLENKYSSKKLEQGISSDPEVMLSSTYEIAIKMAMANLEMEEVVNVDPEKISFEEWSKKLNNAIALFEEVEKESLLLEKTAEAVSIEEELSFWKTKKVNALDSQEILATFDAAPAGKRIRTLAKHLGVDARRAHAMLKVAQGEVLADSWNKAGDTFEKLENGAKVVKNVSKVGLYVGGAMMTGGATSTVGTIIAEGGAIISGADLVLEIGEDSANMAFGYNKQNKVAAIFGDLRKITEPGATILGLAQLDAGDAYGKFSAFMLGADQINSAVQDNKYLGIAPDFEKAALKLDGMTEDDLKPWLKKYGVNEKPDNYKDVIRDRYSKLTGIDTTSKLDVNISQGLGTIPEEKPKKIQNKDCSLIGEWTIIDWYDSSGQKKENNGHGLKFTSDNKIAIGVADIDDDGTLHYVTSDIEIEQNGCSGSYHRVEGYTLPNTFEIENGILTIKMSYGEVWVLKKIK